MGLLKFRKGIKQNLPEVLEEDNFYLLTDSKQIHINDIVLDDANNIKKYVDEKVEEIENINSIQLTYDELVNLRNETKLIPNTLYRITDYVTTTIQNNTKSANHRFYVIVKALSSSELSEQAWACDIKSETMIETYFDNSDLSAWELKYCLDNDNTRFAWADTINGKGVIYYMKDEFNNEAWYDFKNIQFLRTKEWILEHPWFTPTASLEDDTYFFTFSRIQNGVVIDDSLGTGEYPTSDNKLGHSTATVPTLNNTIFIGNGSFSNYIQDGHSNNTFGSNCWNNIIGPAYKDNVAESGFQRNVIGAECRYLKFQRSFTNNTIGCKAYNNNFNLLSNCKIGNYFYYNNFITSNDTNDKVMYCTFGDNLQYISDIPSSMYKVKFEDEVINSNGSAYLSNCITNNGENILTVLSQPSRIEEIIFYKNEEGKYALDRKSDISKNDEKITRLTKNIYYLGEYSLSKDAEDAAKNPNISTNKDMVFLLYYLPNDNKNGLIRQNVSGLKTYQYILWDGVEKRRELEFTEIFGGKTLINITDWEEYYADKTTVNDIIDVIEEDEEVIASSLNDLNERIIINNELISDMSPIVDRLNNSILYMGEFTNSGDAENEAYKPEIGNNKDIIFLHYKVPSSNKNGIIRQQVSDLTTYQYIYWDGVDKRRTITYEVKDGVVTYKSKTSWEDYHASVSSLNNLNTKVNNVITSAETTNTSINTISANTDSLSSEIQNINNQLSSHTEGHTNISLKADTNDRSVATKPSDYLQKFKVSGIKLSSTIGVGSDYGMYSSVVGIHPWHEQSGIDSHEIAFTQYGKLLHRNGSSGWGGWKRIIEDTDIASHNTNGVVKISSAYTETATDTALSLQGANSLYTDINSSIETLANSATTLNEKVQKLLDDNNEDDEVLSFALNDLNLKIQKVSGQTETNTTNIQEAVSTINDRITVLNTNIENVSAYTYNQLSQSVETISTKQNEINEQISGIIQTQESQSESLNEVNENISQCTQDVSTINTELSNLKTHVNENVNISLETLALSAITLNENIQKVIEDNAEDDLVHARALNDLNNKIKSVNEKITDNTNTINESISVLNTNINTISGDVENIKSDIEELKIQIENTSDSLNTLSQDLKSLIQTLQNNNLI